MPAKFGFSHRFTTSFGESPIPRNVGLTAPFPRFFSGFTCQLKCYREGDGCAMLQIESPAYAHLHRRHDLIYTPLPTSSPAPPNLTP